MILVEVSATRLPGEFWLIRTQYAGINETGAVEIVVGPPMAVAIVRVGVGGA